jgi:microcystin-dependent protein
MSTPYIGEIRMFGGNFAPIDWAFCNGQLIAISQNPTLFNLIGTIYGGDGAQTFALPNLQSRIPVHMGSGPGLATYVIGEQTGVEQVTLITNQMPAHNHLFSVNTATASSTNPTNNLVATPTNASFTSAYDVTMATSMITLSGGNQPHSNIQPILAVSFIIAQFGVYPSQN